MLLALGMIAMVSLITARADTAEIGKAPESEVEIVNEYREVFDAMTAEDLEALREVVYWESARAGCAHEVNVAVVETVMNRVLSGRFRDTVYGVCHQKGQFVCKAIPRSASREMIDDAIAQVCVVGRQVLPSTEYQFFATAKQSLGCDHVWIGEFKANGKPRKGKGMYFCRSK